jgi:hypothetical protein
MKIIIAAALLALANTLGLRENHQQIVCTKDTDCPAFNVCRYDTSGTGSKWCKSLNLM